MTKLTTSSRGLMKAMLLTGGAQVINISLSIFRMKILALLLGPTGIGLLSIFNSLQSMVTSTAGLGLSSSGVRQIASAKGEAKALIQVRRVLLMAHLIQGGMAMFGIWVLRVPIAGWLLNDESYATEVGLIGIAVLLSLLSIARTTLLQGLRRVENLAQVTIVGALLATVFGLAAVWFYGQAGLIWFVLVQPLGTFAVALYFTGRLHFPTALKPTMPEVWALWKPMVKLGAVFMLGGLATTSTLLLVRSLIAHELGLDAAGQFAAAWGITMTYVGILLGAMGADYYPRLSEVINDRPTAISLMNDQAQLGLAIGGPILLLLIGLAPWAIHLLFSSEFGPAATLLQWQTVGNVFKLASWVLSISIVAAARGKTYFVMEMSFNIVFLALVWLLLPMFGLGVAAIAFLVAYMVYFSVANMLARRLHGFRWEKLSLQLLGTHMVLAFALLALALTAPLAGALASGVLAVLTGLIGLRIVLQKVGPAGRLASRIAKFYKVIGWSLEKIDD